MVLFSCYLYFYYVPINANPEVVRWGGKGGGGGGGGSGQGVGKNRCPTKM